jgi:hypothetical protein
MSPALCSDPLPVYDSRATWVMVLMFAPVRAACLILAGMMLSACALGSIQGENNLQAPARPVSRLVAYVSAPDSLVPSFQANIQVEAAKHGLSAENALVLFPPTRRYADSQIRQELAVRSIDSVLIIDVGNTGVQREYAGTIFQGRSRVSSGAGEAAVASVNGYPRETMFSARLLDGATGRQLWAGTGQVGGNGFLSFGSGGPSVSDSVADLFDDLQAKGVIGPHETGAPDQPAPAR